MTTNTFSIGPQKTPALIKYLIFSIVFCSLLWAISARFFPYFTSEYLIHCFGLSSYGIKQGYIWQFVSYLFVQKTMPGISFGFLFDLAFKAYILWVFGTSLLNTKGVFHFLMLFFLGGALTGISIATFMMLTSFPLVVMGTHAAIYSILMAWMLLNSHARIYLFFAIPLKVTWGILGFWGINLVIDLTNGNWIQFLMYLISGLFGYFYAVIAFKTMGPLPFLHKLEKKLIAFRMPYKKKKRPSKIFDFKTGEPITDDDQFMDAMLAKISKKGKDSLTQKEKNRMDAISQKGS